LRGDEVLWQPVEATPRGLPMAAVGHDLDDAYRFCTEALIAGRDGGALSPAEVRTAVEGLGESLVVAGGERRLRIHLHTNEPQRFLAAVAEYGVIERSKVDDMVLQQLQGRTSTIALVTDSTIDLPESLAFRMGVVAVPLTLTLGEEEYLDGVDITLDEYVQRIEGGTAVPRSSQPAVADFVQTYRRLLEYREAVVSVHVAGATSGTVEAARAAARQVDPARVRVIDTCAVSVGAGLVVEAVAEAIAAGAELDEVVAAGERARHDTRLVGTVASLDFAVRGGRVSPVLAGTLARLRLAPIIVFDETGRPGKGGAAWGFDRALRTLVRRTARFAGAGGGRAMVAHSGDRAAAEYVAAGLRQELGGDVPIVVAGAVLTTHVGIGAVAAAVRRSRPV
jgi:DegV family protein with EDD domain